MGEHLRQSDLQLCELIQAQSHQLLRLMATFLKLTLNLVRAVFGQSSGIVRALFGECPGILRESFGYRRRGKVMPLAGLEDEAVLPFNGNQTSSHQVNTFHIPFLIYEENKKETTPE